MGQTQRRFLKSAAVVTIAAVGLQLLFLRLKSPANLYDEALILQGAERIMRGQVPYRDFWTLYAPGYFYALAALFHLTGPNVLAARVFDLTLRVLQVVAIYVLARRMTAPWVAVIPTALAALWLGTIGYYSYPAFPATAAILTSVLLLSRYLDCPHPGWLAATGAGLGVTALLRLDFGGYLGIGLGVGVLIFQFQQPLCRGPMRRRLISVLGGEAVIAIGAIVVALPLYGYVTFASGLVTVWEDLIVFPASVYLDARYLPVPHLIPDLGSPALAQWEDWIRFYLPIAIYILAFGISTCWLFKKDSEDDPRFRKGILLITLAITGLGLVIKAAARYHGVHALPTTILACIAGTALAYCIRPRWWRLPPFRLGFAGVAFLLLCMPYVFRFGVLAARSLEYTPWGCYSHIARAGCVAIARDQEKAIEYVQAHAQPGEYVFVANSRHDRIVLNDLLFNFLADRPSPTRYPELHPGLATTLPVQQAIVTELQSKEVNWVVIMQSWESTEPNTSSISSGVTYLDGFIRGHYTAVATFGSYEVMSRR